MTRRWVTMAGALAACVTLAQATGCSSSSSGGPGTGSSSGGGSGGGSGGSSSGGSSGGGSGSSSGGSSSGADGGCSGSTPVSLTVKNFDAWCSVTIGTGAASPAAAQTVCVAAGSVKLSATPLSGFELGPTPWHDTSGDTGTGDPGTVSGGASSTTVAVTSGSKCVWVCCPFTSGSGCPTTDQCP